MSKNRGGRPTRCRKEFAEQAKNLCRLGAIDVELADFFGASMVTLDNWKTKSLPVPMSSLEAAAGGIF